MSRSTVREVSRGSFYLGLEQLTTIIGGIFYSIVVLRMLGPAAYGTLSLGQAAIGLAGVLTTNVEAYLERFVGEIDARGDGHILRPLVRKVLAVKVVLALAAGVLVFLLADTVATAYGHRDLRRLLPVLAPLILLEGAGYALRVTLFGMQRFRSIWLVSLGNNLLKLAIVVLLWRLNEGVVALVAGLVFVQAFSVAALGALVERFLPRERTGAPETPTHRKIWQYVLPLLGARAFFLSGQHLNRLILGALLPARELGLASFALMTIERFIALLAAVPNSLLPALSRLRGEGRDGEIERTVTEGYRVVAAMALLLMAGTYCLARETVWITGGGEFLPAVVPLQILALTPLFRTMQQPLTMCFYTYERTKIVFWLAAIKFAVEPLAYPLLIPRLGVSGAALASLLSSVVVFGPSVYLADRILPQTASLRHRATAIVWSIGVFVAVAGWFAGRIRPYWPDLAARLLLTAAALAAILFLGRLIRGDDLRRFAEASRRGRVARLMGPVAGWLDRAQKRPAA